MTDQLKATVQRLRELFEQQQIDETMYRALLEGQGLTEAQIQATLAGSGNVAIQGSRIEAGEKAVIASKAEGSIITGDGNSVQTIINYYLAGRPPAEAATLKRQVASYLTWLLDRYGKIELRGIKREGEQVVQLNLEKIYVPLQAKTYQRAREQEIELNQVLQLGERVVITGGPGCGKTTVLLHLAWSLTQAIGLDRPDLAQAKLGLSGDLPLPILIPLSAYAQHLRHLTPAAGAEEKTLASFITHYLIQHEAGFELPPDFFKQLLQSGQSVLLLLDGLDEVPDDNERAVVRQAIENLVTGRERMRVVVTCRTAAYKERTALGKDFREVQVLPLDPEHLANLVRHAYADIYRHEPASGQGKATELLQAIERLEADRRRRFGEETEPLIASPLLVRMLLVVHYSERRLPDQRAELYLKATDAMLLPEYLPDEAQANRLGGLVGGSREVHRELVQHLAFAMHQRGEQQGREIDEDDLRQILQAHPSYGDKTPQLIALTRLRGTLLEERLGVYRFIHLAFQEFLAARYLAETLRSQSGLAGIVTFFENGPILESWWREPALLVAGYLSLTALTSAPDYLLRLAGADDQAAKRASRPGDIQLAAAEVAASAALEWPTAPEPLKARLAGRLAELFQTPAVIGQAKPGRRAAAGAALARLGDPRPGVTSVEDMQFCYVPRGSFMMGSPADDAPYDNEKPLREQDLPYGYWLARYPVTVAQFKTFVVDQNFKLGDQDSLSDPLNHPVRSVTWHEALAFCRWLTKKWREEGLLPAGWQITLPSEAEWEKAARGGQEIPAESIIGALPDIDLAGFENLPGLVRNPQPQRRYPWGNDIDPSVANFDQTGLGTTSAVGCFPGGTSPYGSEEMSGNVWEWTRSIFKDYPYNPQDGRENLKAGDDARRVLRGGAFFYPADFARCAIRSNRYPGFSYRGYGFRVVCCPHFSSSDL